MYVVANLESCEIGSQGCFCLGQLKAKDLEKLFLRAKTNI